MTSDAILAAGATQLREGGVIVQRSEVNSPTSLSEFGGASESGDCHNFPETPGSLWEGM